MSGRTIISNAEVFDGTSFLGPRDVVIEDGKFSEIAEAGIHTEQNAGNANFIDATGKTLTPGIIDCHIHASFQGAGSLDSFVQPFSYQFFACVDHLSKTLHGGVTTARDAGGTDAGAKLALANGIIAGPKLRTAITIMSQTGGHGDGRMASGVDNPMTMGHPGRPSGVADGVEEVRKKVREILRAGADQIKITSTGGVLSPSDDPRHSQLTVEEIQVIVAEASYQGKYVMSHAQGTQGIKNALMAGVRSIEHGIYLDEEAIAMFLENGAYLVPTLQAPQAVLKAADAGANLPAAIVAKAKLVAETHEESIKAAYAAGVKIAMGTDAGVGPHGENLEELELMEKLGMSTADVLVAATSRAAELMDMPNVGCVAPGKDADVVLFTGNLKTTGLKQARAQVDMVFQDGERKR